MGIPKVHHSATVLTPFANWRVHPVDSIVYMNIQAIIVGSVSGLIQYVAGEAFSLTSTAIVGMLLAGYMALWGHAQHSQFWISCTGLAGRIFLSPSHHQIHHSLNPIHFDKNFGASLALWDWLFRTLVGLVTVPWMYLVSVKNFDTHSNHFQLMRELLLPAVDRAFSALLEDLDQRNLLPETLVAWTGEFGRTPKVNASAGRDHWGSVYSTVLAGGGIRGGQIY